MHMGTRSNLCIKTRTIPKSIPPTKLGSCFTDRGSGADHQPVAMPDNATTCTLNTFGTFSTPTFAAVGEPYDSKKGTGASRRHSRPSGTAQHTHLADPPLPRFESQTPTPGLRACSSRPTSSGAGKRETTGTATMAGGTTLGC